LSWGGLPGRLVAVGAGTLQLSLDVLGAGLKPGAGVFCRRELGFELRFLLGLVPRGVLADLRYLPVRGLAGTVQLRAGRLGSLPRPGRVLLGIAGPGLGLARPAVRLVPLLLRPGHPLLRGPLVLGGPCLRGRGLLLGGSLGRQRLGQLRIGLQRRQARLPGISLGLVAALRASAAIPPHRDPRAAQILRPSHSATVRG